METAGVCHGGRFHARPRADQTEQKKKRIEETKERAKFVWCGWYRHDGGGMYRNLELCMFSRK